MTTRGQTIARTINRIREKGGLTAQDIADAVGVGLRQVQNWAAGTVVPNRRDRLESLMDLQYVVELLSEVYTDEGIVMWLHARNRMLGGDRPLELLRERRVDDVIHVIEQLDRAH